MSEYQYYEFQAVDRSLNNKEMTELRSFSTRAEISPNSFVNTYSWGDFKGDKDQWMEKYFDGFLYYANWGTHILKLRLPSTVLDLETVLPYCGSDYFSARLSNDKIILDFLSENEGGDVYEEDLRLSQFLNLRSDLSRGDLRSLYLGWLSSAQNDEFDEEELEPLVPPGLAQLTPSLITFADFLRIDFDLIEAAAKMSPSLEQALPHSNDIRAWLTALAANEKENLIVAILEGGIKGDQAQYLQLLHRFNKEWQLKQALQDGHRKRTVAELLQEAECVAQLRRRREAEKAAADQAERQRLKKLAREKRLSEIVGQESMLWEQIESLVSEKKSASYDKAMELLIDLRDLAACGDVQEFLMKVDTLRQRHSSKSSFIARLRNLDLPTSNL